MATVRSFPGIVFDPTRIPDPSAVTCPPYDVISPAERDALYEQHPYNVVRIVSGKEETGDTTADNRYTRAAGFFRSWLWEGVLRDDPEPGLYVYRQAFTDPSRRFRRVWGVIGTISLDDEILAHEQTMAGPKADRLALMDAVPANLSPIYALYRDDSGVVSPLLRDVAGQQALADFVDRDGTRHTVWANHDAGFQAKVADAVAASPIMIADGHHRFETAKAYRAKRGGPGPWDDIMTLLVDVSCEPVCILPYHRIVRRCVHADPLPVLREHFDVERIPDGADPEATGLALWDETRPGVFVCYTRAGAWRLVARTGLAPDEIPAGVLKRLALDPLGVEFAEDCLTFTPRATEVAATVADGEAICGFLIQPVDVERVWTLARSGARMPEKSTYFHPKPRDGIVMRLLERP